MTRQAESSSPPAWSASDLSKNPHEAVDKPERVHAMFTAIADSYDLNNRVHSLWRDQAWRRKAVALCEVQPADCVLDVACGTGDLAEAFARAGAASVHGVDFTEEMLAIARRKAARRGPPGESAPHFQCADAMNLPFEDARFDIVSIAFGIRNVRDPAAALGEMRRVLRIGGRLVVLEFSEPRNAVLRWASRLYRERLMPVTAAWLARDRSGAYRYLPRSVRTFAHRQALAGMMRSAGFASISLHPMTFGICVAYLGRAE
jgi:demethylmenaquinone methyltransferase/2-methoxy-6-polyprenyl-1,4-benzoquinol methylase